MTQISINFSKIVEIFTTYFEEIALILVFLQLFVFIFSAVYIDWTETFDDDNEMSIKIAAILILQSILYFILYALCWFIVYLTEIGVLIIS